MSKIRRSQKYSKDNVEKDSSQNKYYIVGGQGLLDQLKVVETQIAEAVVEANPSIPFVRKMEEWEWEWIVDNDYMYKDKPMKEKLIGNWFLCRTKDGHLFITKDTPVKFDTGFMINKDPKDFISGWLCLDQIGGSSFSHGEYRDLHREDFLCLDLPEVTEENPMLEIEIMPSGKVYFYV